MKSGQMGRIAFNRNRLNRNKTTLRLNIFLHERPTVVQMKAA